MTRTCTVGVLDVLGLLPAAAARPPDKLLLLGTDDGGREPLERPRLDPDRVRAALGVHGVDLNQVAGVVLQSVHVEVGAGALVSVVESEGEKKEFFISIILLFPFFLNFCRKNELTSEVETAKVTEALSP